MTDRTADTALPFIEAATGRSLWGNAWRRLRANRAAVASVVFLALMALVCLIGPAVLPHAYDRVFQDYVKVPARLEAYPRADQVQPALDRALRRVRLTLAEPAEITADRVTAKLASRSPIDPRLGEFFDRTDLFIGTTISGLSEDRLSATLTTGIRHERFLFGTDANGRDLLTRTLIAGRISLSIGILATFVALLIGVAYGAAAGYLGGRVDLLMMRVVDILYSLPFIFFVILLVVFFGRNFVLIFIAVGAIEWLDMARIVRGQTIALKRQEFVQAAEALGVGSAGILRRHIVPNTLGPVVVFMTLLVPKVILLESFLSFLGLGVQEPMTSWGVLIAQGASDMQGAPWLLVFPSLFLTGTLFALNFLGDGLRDALDPRDR